MLNSIKIYNESLSLILQVKYSQLNLSKKLKKELQASHDDFLNLEFIRKKYSLFNSYYTKIDIYLYKKDNKIICNSSEIDINSEAISNEDIFKNLDRILLPYLNKEIQLLNKNNLLNFIYKHNLMKFASKIIHYYKNDSLISYVLKTSLKIDSDINISAFVEEKDFILFIDKLKINTNVIANAVNPKKLDYFRRVFYFFKMASKFEAEDRKYSACSYYLHCYTALKDGSSPIFKRFLREKIISINIWDDVFKKIFEKTKKPICRS